MGATEIVNSRPRSKTVVERSHSPFTSPLFSSHNSPGSHRQDLPAWDRTFDAVYHKHAQGEGAAESHSSSFSTSLSRFFKERNRKRLTTSSYFGLPDSVRYLICQYVLAPHRADKPIRLNRRPYIKDCWGDADFTSPSKALLPLKPYLAVSFPLRADILVAFLSSSTFHATFSPYVGPRVNPLATTWLSKYGSYMRNIVIEVDLSCLGLGPKPDATRLLSGIGLVENLIHDFVKAQLRRDKECPLNSLILLCRRFYGMRSDALSAETEMSYREKSICASRQSQRPDLDTAATEDPETKPRESEETRVSSPDHTLHQTSSSSTRHSTEDSERQILTRTPDTEPPSLKSPILPLMPTEYCPDSYLSICNHFLRLRNRIDSIRMCGFNETYTSRFIITLFPYANEQVNRHAYRVSPSTIWPRLAGQKSFIDRGDGYPSLDDHGTTEAVGLPKALSRWEGCVQLPPPTVDDKGRTSLPLVVGAMQRLRTSTVGSSTSLPEKALSRHGELELVRNFLPPHMIESERAKIRRLLGNYGKTRGLRKRTLSREVATTL